VSFVGASVGNVVLSFDEGDGVGTGDDVELPGETVGTGDDVELSGETVGTGDDVELSGETVGTDDSGRPLPSDKTAKKRMEYTVFATIILLINT